MSTVAVYGLGHVGLPLAAVLSAHHEVFGVDPRAEQILGGPHLEPGLADAIHRVRIGAPARADVAVIAVPTPWNGASADLSFVRQAAEAATARLRDGGLLWVASTCPVGTAASLPRPRGVCVVAAPERGMPGQMLHELVHAPRLVGGTTPAATEAGVDFAHSFVEGDVYGVTAEEAELSKLAENAWRDLSIAYATELAEAAVALGLDGRRLVALASTHPRVALPTPGIGVGGHCLPVDPHFLPTTMMLPRLARAIHQAQPHRVAARIVTEASRRGARSIGLLGLAYKANTADARNAPAVEIARLVPSLAHDPHVTAPGVRQASLDEVLATDFRVKLVAHDAYADLAVDWDLSA